ncbi:MAG: carbamoyl-phosphate-synthetase [Croceivirga sp.]
MSKKLILLGGNPETGVLVDISVSMGIYTIVVDPNPDAPAKRNASESYEIDGFNVDKIVNLAREKNVDGVLVGVADILVKPYWEICMKLGLPCYATEKAVEAFCSKDGFKRYCEKYGVQDIPGIYLTRNSGITKPKGLNFPLMVKPVDSGAGVGMKICRNENDYTSSVVNALKFSKKGVILVEQYMDCDDMAAYYTFKDGVPLLSATYDRITTKQQGDSSPVCLGALYPSKHTELFMKKVHPKLCDFFEQIGVQNGILNLQFFVDNGSFYAYDPGFRLQGEAPHIHLSHINGFDHRKMLLNFAFTGVFGEDNFQKKNDFTLDGKSACTIWVLLSSGKINDIKGLEILNSDKNVIFISQRFKKGDTVYPEWLGTERQVFARIYVVEDSPLKRQTKINEFKSTLKISDEKGNNMIVSWL